MSPDDNYSQLIAQQLNFLKLKAKCIQAHEVNITRNCIKIMNMNSVKGLEFPFVVVVGLKEGFLPRLTEEIDEEKPEIIKQQRNLFYVACSRAMRSLLVFGSNNHQSQFLEPLINSEEWECEIL